MYSLKTITSLRDLDVTVYRGSRFVRFHVYEAKGHIHADTIQKHNWDKDANTVSHIKDVLRHKDLGITALLHQGYNVECKPIAKGSDLQQSDEFQERYNCLPPKRVEQREEQDRFFEA